MTSRLEEIEARLNAATPGPWYAKATDDEMAMNARYVTTVPGTFEHDNKLNMAMPTQLDTETIIAITLLQSPRLADADRCDENSLFIAHAPDDIRYLLSELTRRDEQIKILREALEFYANEKTWEWSDRESGPDDAIDDDGKIARAALAEIEKEDK